jgi:hypothetical protein
MKRIIRSAFFIALTLLEVSCSTKAEGVIPPVKGMPISGVRIAWDYSSQVNIAPIGGYARVLHLSNNSLVAVYENYRGNAEMRCSYDLGTTWSEPTTIFSKFTYTNGNGQTATINISNPEIYQLKNGDLIIGCNYRPVEQEIAPYSIAIRRSSDLGKTWSDTQVLYDAAPRFGDGCWEPSFLQLPNGELQVYFANENPYRNSNEQQISMLSSQDNGVTWSKEPKMISYRANRRDGMPVPLIVNDEIVVSIEDNKIGEFKPYTVRTKIADNWNIPVLENSSLREYALSETLPDNVYAGAPYLAKLPSGEVILSYQSTENRTTNWENSVMEVAIGDKTARHFTKRTRPFDVPLSGEGKWNSLSVIDNSTVMAVSSTNFKGGSVGVWGIKGHIIPELKFLSGNITVDGNVATVEWGSTLPVFVGSKSETNLYGGFKTDGTTLYMAANVADKVLYADGSNVVKSDGVYFYIDPQNTLYSTVEKGIYRIWISYTGKVKVYEGNQGRWVESKMSGIVAKSALHSGGYSIEVSLPLNAIKKNDQNPMRMNVGLSSFSNSYEGNLETIANSSELAPNTWCEVSF